MLKQTLKGFCYSFGTNLILDNVNNVDNVNVNNTYQVFNHIKTTGFRQIAVTSFESFIISVNPVESNCCLLRSSHP